MEFEYSDDQKNAIKAFMKFLINPKEKFMIIQGNAGTGKSTMIKAMIEAMNKEYKLLQTLLCQNPKEDKFEIILSATTNKAAAVLCELSNNPTVRTVHSTLGLVLKKNFHTGTEDLVKTNRWMPLNNTILIMDEASMLDQITFDYMNETLIGKSKAVLIGDVFQLAPIKQKKSTMQTMLHNIPTATMNKVLRHGGDILEAANAFREVVKTNCFEDILLSDAVIHIDGPSFKKEVVTAFLDPKYTPEKAKILAWSNDRVQEYNRYLRKARGLGERFQKEESVVTNNPIINDGHLIPVDTEVKITHVYGETTKHKVNGQEVIINGIITAFLPDNYKDAKILMKKLAKEANSKEIQNDPKRKKELWEEYFNIKDTWLDLRSQYASTVHKAQGSSYDKVFIDLDDIGRCNIATDVARMLYVAISRSRKRVILSGELPAKYRGK